MHAKSAISHSIDSLSDVIDSVPFDSLPDLEAPDMSAVSDALLDASNAMADTAVVIGRQGGRYASRTARAAWKNREAVATVAVVVLVLVAIASVVKKKKQNTDDTDES